MSTKKPFDWSTPLAYLVAVLIFAAMFVIVFVIRLWITGGDVSCVFSPDPALCAAVKSVR